MYQTKILAFILLTLTACEKQDTVSQSELIPITLQYPADYFTVLKTPKPTQKPCETKAVIEKLAEEKAQKIVLKKEKEKQKKEQKKPQKKEIYASYLEARTNIIRRIRQKKGAEILSSQTLKEESIKHFPSFKTKIKAEDKTYLAPNITSGFPVDRSFILTEDRTIPALLVDSLNSQIGGTIRAVVSEDVFGANGRYKLLEKGDVVLGRYEKTSKIGETRIEVLFYRILRAKDGAEIYSSGKAFAYAADKMGRTGLIGEVDNRNWERYGLAFSTSLIGGLAGLGKSKVSGDEYEEFWNKLSDNTTEITGKILESYMNIAPIITIAQGEPILIRLATDITLKKGELL